MDGFGFHWVEFGGISVGLYENTMTSVDQRWIKMFFLKSLRLAKDRRKVLSQNNHKDRINMQINMQIV